MNFAPIIPTDLQGEFLDYQKEKANKIIEKSLLLTSTHNKIVLDEIINLLRTTNSYYSNRIESQGTHPINIYNAMNGNFDNDKKSKLLQQLSLVHIEVQKIIEDSFEKQQNIFSSEHIKYLHKEFYSKKQMQEFLYISNNGLEAKIIPGIFRSQNVRIGQHIPIEYEYLSTNIDEFVNIYNKEMKNKTKAEQLIYILASHHRLVYLHPFLDGNGRISRLFLDYLFFKIDIKGYGLWNIARGLARSVTSYKQHLSLADMVVQGSTEGRGPLSNRSLKQYIDYMLDTALDQVEYMYNNLQLSVLSNRLNRFVQLSSTKQINNIIIEKYADLLFDQLLIKGELKRSLVGKIIGKSDRTASRLIKQLLDNGLIKSKSHKSPISLNINPRFASYLFPELFPEIV
jgi:Fic family protein